MAEAIGIAQERRTGGSLSWLNPRRLIARRLIDADEVALLSAEVRVAAEELEAREEVLRQRAEEAARAEDNETQAEEPWPLKRRVDSFVQYGVEKPLNDNASHAPLYGAAFTALSVTVIALGLLSSVLASGDHANDNVIAAVGVAIGVLTAINQIWKPAQRSVSRYQAANALRHEGWDLVMARGRYRKLDGRERLNEFIDEVGRIQRGVESIDEQASEAAAPQA